MQSPDGAFPTASSYAHKLLLDKQNTTRTLAICPSQLAQGDWKVGRVGAQGEGVASDPHLPMCCCLGLSPAWLCRGSG